MATGGGAATPGRQHRAGDPKLREGSHFSDWLLERRWRAESALVNVVATSYLGVSARGLEELVLTLGIPGCRSRGCQRWPKISTHRWTRSGPAR